MHEFVITTNRLTKYFGEYCAVYMLNLRVPQGTIFGFLGPNGAGKTTTIKIITGLLRPTYGEARIFGFNVFSKRRLIMRRIGYQPEKAITYAGMTAFEFVRYIARLYGFSSAEAAERAREALDFVGLGRLANHIADKLSSGEKQRLMLAKAIVNMPELLILDEPTANLDPIGRIEILDKIRELVKEQGVTVFVSSHILSEIERIASHVAIITQGKLLLQGRISEVISAVRDNSYVIRTTEHEKLLQELEKLSYIRNIDVQDSLIIVNISPNDVQKLWVDVPKLANELHVGIIEFRPLHSPLESAFMRALGGRAL